MKTLARSVLFSVLTAVSHGSEELKFDGSFWIDANVLTCSIQNLNMRQVVIEGLKDELLEAKYFSKDNREIPRGNKFPSSINRFQEWTRLLPANPDGVNPGAVYRQIMHYSNLPIKQAGEIEYLVFEVKVYPLAADNRLLEGEKVKITLKKK